MENCRKYPLIIIKYPPYLFHWVFSQDVASICFRVLMQHLLDNWDGVSGKVDKKLLHQTVQSFMRTNEEMVQNRSSSGDWDALQNVCEVRI